MDEQRAHEISGHFEKRIIFENGATIAVTISYDDVAPQDAIKVISGLEILSKQVLSEVKSFKKVTE